MGVVADAVAAAAVVSRAKEGIEVAAAGAAAVGAVAWARFRGWEAGLEGADMAVVVDVAAATSYLVAADQGREVSQSVPGVHCKDVVGHWEGGVSSERDVLDDLEEESCRGDLRYGCGCGDGHPENVVSVCGGDGRDPVLLPLYYLWQPLSGGSRPPRVRDRPV